MAGPSPSRATRVLAALSLLAAVGTYAAAQVDFVRRHRPGIAPGRYWIPQLTQIWLPGLVGAAVLAVAALVIHRRRGRG